MGALALDRTYRAGAAYQSERAAHQEEAGKRTFFMSLHSLSCAAVPAFLWPRPMTR